MDHFAGAFTAPAELVPSSKLDSMSLRVLDIVIESVVSQSRINDGLPITLPRQKC
jgi:hypothetical protein